MNLFGRFINGKLVHGPSSLPMVWYHDKKAIRDFNKLENNLSELATYNWFPIEENQYNINPKFENINFGEWTLTEGTLHRDITITEFSFEKALTVNSNILKQNRYIYETSDFVYQFGDMQLVIMTDAVSQSKLSDARMAAVAGTRIDTDIWRFKQLNKNEYAVVITNNQIIEISNFVYRKIQDSYNLLATIMNQMLATGDTATLKQQISNGAIDLNPWVSMGVPWVI